MSKRRERSEPRERRTPMATVANITDDFIANMHLPVLPDGIPTRLEEGLRARIDALLYRLREARSERYVHALEVRLVREAYHAVLAGYELHIPESEVLYAQFRRLIADLGYRAADVGFIKDRPEDPEITRPDG